MNAQILEVLTALDGTYFDDEGFFVNASHNGMTATIALDHGNGHRPEVYVLIPQRIS